MKKIIIILLLFSFSAHAADADVGPVGPQSTTPPSIGEEQTEKPKVDLPYKPKTDEKKPTTVDVPVIKKQIVVEPVPSIPAKSPEPSVPPDPNLD